MNGCKGVDFSAPDLREEQVAAAFRHVLASGTAGFLPTVITSPVAVYERNLPLLVEVMRQEEFKDRVLGLHVEGPFISDKPGAVGAHQPDCVREPDPEFLLKLQELADGTIRFLTIAAEIPGADALCRRAVDMGITVSLGHQLATEADLSRLAAAGAAALTHLGNGIPNMLPRHPNMMWAGLAEDRLTAMLITDGHHLPAQFIKTTLRAKGMDRVVVTSDASSMAGMPAGEYHSMGNRIVLEESGKLWNPDKQCLVGSSAMMFDCMNFLASLGLLQLEELLAVGFGNPLRLISIDPAGVCFPAIMDFDDKTGFRLI